MSLQTPRASLTCRAADSTETFAPTAGDAVARLTGYFLLLAFFGLGASSNGFRITFRGSLSASSPGELNFWLGSVLLLCPATLLIGYGYASRLDPFLLRIATWITRLDAQQRRRALLLLALLSLAAARIGRAVFLLDLPLTDDELAVEFGGRIIASGHMMAHLGVPHESIPGLFLYFRNGAVGSFDWVGGQVVAAVAEITRLGPLVWAALAVVPIASLGALVRTRLGPGWGGVAALIFICSPMAALLSFTTHAQLASRAFFSLALLAFSSADLKGGLDKWVLTGAGMGLMFLCRPPETVFLCAPLVVWALVQTARRTPEYRPALVGLAAGFLPALALFFWQCYATTGNPLLPARFAANAVDVTSTSLWSRFGDNMSYNVLMLALWFLGPLGLLLVAAGVLKDRFTRLLGVSVAADLCLALFHDNSGLHIVGPIHYSECAVPLTVLATAGMAKLVRLVGNDQAALRLRSALAVGLTLGLGTFTLIEALALRNQAQLQHTIYEAVDRAVQDPDGQRAVVLTPWFFAIVNAFPDTRELGTWVHDWRRPRVDLEDPVLYLRDAPEVEPTLRARFPDRRFFRLQPLRESPFVLVTPLDRGSPKPLELGN